MAHKLRTLVRQVETNLVEKRSRFITRAAPVSSEEEARAFIDSVSEPKATHNCYAYRIDKSTFRYNDDGEPSGTAGAPIFSAIAAGDYIYTVVVVTRYFGGIKLGTGGLTRAYGRAAQECLAAGETMPFVPTVDVKVKVEFQYVGQAFQAVERYQRLEAVNSATGCELKVRVPEHQKKKFADELKNATKGTAILTFEDNK